MNVSIPVEDDAEDIILDAHVGVSAHELMRRVCVAQLANSIKVNSARKGNAFIIRTRNSRLPIGNTFRQTQVCRDPSERSKARLESDGLRVARSDCLNSMQSGWAILGAHSSQNHCVEAT